MLANEGADACGGLSVDAGAGRATGDCYLGGAALRRAEVHVFYLLLAELGKWGCGSGSGRGGGASGSTVGLGGEWVAMTIRTELE